MTSSRVRGVLVAVALLAPHVVQAQLGGQFRYPVSVAVDRSTNVLVSENERQRIDMYGPNGALGWRVGSQGSGDGQFENPAGIAADNAGYVYVADVGNARIQKFLVNTGAFVTKWGSYGTGPRQFRKPRAIAVDAQNHVFVLDNQNMTIQKFSSDGATYFGSWGGQSGTGDGQFSVLAGGPSDLAIDAAGFVYISDPGNQRIHRWRIVSNAAGNIQSATFVGWNGGCTSGANCDVANQRSNAFTCTAATCSAPIQGTGAGQFINPGGLALDATGGLYVTDTINNRIQQFSSAGTFVRAWGTRGTGNGAFRTPADIAISPNTDVYVADALNERVQRFSAAGVFTTVFGGSIALSASTGYPPRPLDSLVDPNPLFIFPGQTATTAISVTSLSSFQGAVTLDSNGCCLDLLTGAYLPGTVTTAYAPSTVNVPSNGVGTSTLSITAPAAGSPAKLAVPLNAGNPTLGVSAQTGVGIEVLAPIPPDSGVASSCIGGTVVGSPGGGSPGQGPEVLPLSGATTMLYGVKTASPARTSFAIGAASTTNKAGWLITVSKAAMALRADQAFVTFTNSTSWDKGITTVNSANCAAAGQNARVSTGTSSTFVISKADTTTLLLSRGYCRFRFIGCWDNGGWEQFATFDEAGFWNLFGGRHVTIDWVISSGE